MNIFITFKNVFPHVKCFLNIFLYFFFNVFTLGCGPYNNCLFIQILPLLLWHCWLGGRKGIRPVTNWVVGSWRDYLSGVRCKLAYGPADATATHCLLLHLNPDWFCLLVPTDPGSPGQRPLNLCVCVCVCVLYKFMVIAASLIRIAQLGALLFTQEPPLSPRDHMLCQLQPCGLLHRCAPNCIW